MTNKRVPLALTIGDPAGIGPELMAAILAEPKLPKADLWIIGSAAALDQAMPQAQGNAFTHVSHEDIEQAPPPESFPVIVDTGGEEMPPPGRPTAAGGRIAGLAVETAVKLARAGHVEGIVTGPISKEALSIAGYPYSGHTEMFASLFDAPDCQMMMVAGELRIVILTRDIPLVEVPASITGNSIETAVRTVAEALRELWSIQTPRIAVAALNPHAGDGGVTGIEERDIIVPALEKLAHEGIGVDGPIPADTMFYKWREKGYDAYVALYHDQGMIPFKMEGFEKGVNMTVGLPVVRTSVCHGTAFDIVGRGEGNPGSLLEALALAVHCCLQKRKKIRV
jgi:4-hydroxythreonine-4-phosphate dehydrogenase